jgi:hypothetical protein
MKNKIKIFIWSLFLYMLSLPVQAQHVPGFNKELTEPYRTSTTTVVALPDTTYMLLGVGATALTQPYLWVRDYRAILDRNGNVMSVKDDADSSCVLYRDQGILVANRVYTCGTKYKIATGETVAYVMQFDLQGNVLWTKHIDSASYVKTLNKMVFDRLSGRLLVSGVTRRLDSSTNMAWIIALDTTNGQLLRDSVYGSDALHVKLFQGIITPDSGSLWIGSKTGNSGYDDLYLLKLDSSGREIWNRRYDGGLEGLDVGASIVRAADGSGYYLHGVRATTPYHPNYSKIWLLKINEVGDTLWTRTYGADTLERGGGDWLGYTNGRLLMRGMRWYGNQQALAYYMLYVTEQGDSVTERLFYPPVTPPSEDYIMYGNAHSADGGFIAAGIAFTQPQHTWVLKTDSNGCIQENNCFPVGVKETVKVKNGVVLEQNVPNPASGSIRIGFTLPPDFKTASLDLYDYLGRKTATFPLGKSDNFIIVNAERLISGVYFYTLTIDGQCLHSKKMVVYQ